MIVLATFIDTIATLLHYIITAYIFVIIAAALVSWVRPDPYNPIVNFLYKATDPVYAFIRNKLKIPTVFGNLDFAPIILLLALQFMDLFFVRLLRVFIASM